VNCVQTYPPVRTEGRAKSGSSVWTCFSLYKHPERKLDAVRIERSWNDS
jgi:hypothetical protein